jgi:hypothetical protein
MRGTPRLPRQASKEASKPNAGTTAHGVGKSKKKKKVGGSQSLAGAPTAAAAAAAAGGGRGGQRGDKRPRQPSNSDEGGAKCPVHNSTRHTASECREIKKLAKQFREKMQQQSCQDGAPSCRWEGKQKVDKREEEEEMEFQNAKRALKAVYGNSDSESSSNESRKSMVGAGQLPLLVSPTIANIKLYHVLIDGGAALNLISLAAFKKLQIPMGKLQPSRPFSGVGPVSVIPRGCISLPVTFGTTENFRTESILFDVTEVSLPFNAILGRPALYRFMAVAHYGYLVLKMPSPGGVLRIRGDRDAGACALEKLQALAVAREAVAEPRDQSPALSSSRQHVSTPTPRVQPSVGKDVPMKTIQIRADAAQTTRISGDLDNK